MSSVEIDRSWRTVIGETLISGSVILSLLTRHMAAVALTTCLLSRSEICRFWAAAEPRPN